MYVKLVKDSLVLITSCLGRKKKEKSDVAGHEG